MPSWSESKRPLDSVSIESRPSIEAGRKLPDSSHPSRARFGRPIAVDRVLSVPEAPYSDRHDAGCKPAAMSDAMIGGSPHPYPRRRKTCFHAHAEASATSIDAMPKAIRAGVTDRPDVTVAPPILTPPLKPAACP